MKYPKKLIEVALPVDDINLAGITEKNPFLKKHPRSLHLWWARRPLAVVRAVLFAQMVNDPGGERGWGAYKGQTKADAQKERERLFDIIRDLVKWENINNEDVLEKARAEIRKSWKESCEMIGEDFDTMPTFFDPFCGGGAIPLEAGRLGLEPFGSDLNPVAVLICKALIEIPSKFANLTPVGPLPKGERQRNIKNSKNWNGARGLAEDVRRFGAWLRDEAERRIGSLYPQADLPKEYGGGKGTVIAWLWARTVASPNPSVGGIHVPLIRSFIVSSKKGKEVWIEPVVAKDNKSYQFIVRHGEPDNPEKVKSGTKAGTKGTFRCLISGTPIDSKYIKVEGKANRLGSRLIAIVVQHGRNRIFVDPTDEIEVVAKRAEPSWRPSQNIVNNSRHMTPCIYGFNYFSDLFSKRQLVALVTLSDLVLEAKKMAIESAKQAGMPDNGIALCDGGNQATGYGEAIATYLALAVSQYVRYHSTTAIWNATNVNIAHTFGRQAIPMTWDYAESNPISGPLTIGTAVKWVASALEELPSNVFGHIDQFDASSLTDVKHDPQGLIISTDPPYYDNVPYADLSDFFYVWLRRSLKDVFPNLFSTILTPKKEELVADSFRHPSKKEAETFFLDKMKLAMRRMFDLSTPSIPVTIYYAFKQSEKKGDVISLGWETFLEAVIRAGFTITGTWPLNTEDKTRLRSQKSNALASSIILVCRKNYKKSQTISRKQFVRELMSILPDALETMIGIESGSSPIAPVDLAQSSIGPGMAVFSQYTAVLEADGSPMPVRTALTLINKTIDEYFTQVESDMDADTRFCVDWFQQYGFKEGPFGGADILAKAKGTSVEGVKKAGVVESGKGKVRLYRVNEYSKDWNPKTDKRIPTWESCHQIIRALEEGETSAGNVLSQMPAKGEAIRQLAYRLYTVCERKNWGEEARYYNELITSWNAIVEESRKVEPAGEQQRFDF